MPGYTREDLIHRFQYHPPQGNQAERYKKISEAALAFALVVLENTPESADQTVAFRSIELARMQANQSIACNEYYDLSPEMEELKQRAVDAYIKSENAGIPAEPIPVELLRQL